MTLQAITSNLTTFFAACICLACTAIASKVTRQTRCAVRFGIFATFIGALLQVAGGIWNFGDWAELVFYTGVLIYLLANLRVPAALPAEAWSNRAAVAIAIVVAGVLAWTFAGA